MKHAFTDTAQVNSLAAAALKMPGVLVPPARPYEPVPASGTFVMVGYRVEVTVGLAFAIVKQGADRVLPSAGELAEHYGMDVTDVVAVCDELLARQLIRQVGQGYVTQAGLSSASTDSECSR